jgi:Ca2+-transporting ATPase
MARPPRDPRQPFMDRSMQFGIFAGGLSLAAAVVATYLWAWGLGLGETSAKTAAFATWMVGHIVLAAHLRSERQPLLRTKPLANRPFLLWAASAMALVAMGIAVPLLAARLHLVPLPAEVWAVVLTSGLLFPSWWEALKWTHRWQVLR